MTHVDVANQQIKKPHKNDEPNPSIIFLTVIKENPKATEAKHKAMFGGLLMQDSYMDVQAHINREWMNLKYNTLRETAFPPTKDEIEQRMQERREATAENKKTVEKLANKAVARILDWLMPNGKALRDCTGDEALPFAGPLAAMCKEAGARRIGDVFTDERAAQMITAPNPKPTPAKNQPRKAT